MKFIPNALTSKVGVAALHLQKHSPHILFGAGVVGVVGTVVLASRATLKIQDTLIDHKSFIEMVNRGEADDARPDYTHEDAVKDKTIIFVRSITQIAKSYAPAIILGAASIGLLAGSHSILSKRNAAVTAAYAALDKGYREYRERVAAKLGESGEREIKYAVQSEKVTEIDKDGKKKQVEKKFATSVSPYGRFFEESNPNWAERPEWTFMFLRSQQSWLNDRLQVKGVVLLNDVYDALGLERSKEAALVGWVKDSTVGDGFIDFGVFDRDDEVGRVLDFIQGREDGIWLDFNVDGIVYDQI